MGWFAMGGAWLFASSEDGTQALYVRHPSKPDQPALFRIVCNDEDGVVWFNSQALDDGQVERLAGSRHRLDATLSGGGTTLTLEGYASTAPEGRSVAWEAPRTVELVRILGASDFSVAAPSLDLKGGGGTALADFVRACPALPAQPADPLGRTTRTGLADGYRLDIPGKLFRIVWGDRLGRAYESDFGHASLAVIAQANALQQGLEQAMESGIAGLPELERETYRHVTRDAAVVSGFAGSSIVYYKARLTCGGASIVHFTLTYDTAQRAAFDAVATRMSRSFDATRLPDGRPLCP